MNFKEYSEKIKKQASESRSTYLRDKDNFEIEVTSLITEARLYAGLTQEKLAKLISTKQPSIARIENGSTMPSLNFLKKIADALNTYLEPPKFGFMIETTEIKSNSTSDIISHSFSSQSPPNNLQPFSILNGNGREKIITNLLPTAINS